MFDDKSYSDSSYTGQEMAAEGSTAEGGVAEGGQMGSSVAGSSPIEGSAMDSSTVGGSQAETTQTESSQPQNSQTETTAGQSGFYQNGNTNGGQNMNQAGNQGNYQQNPYNQNRGWNGNAYQQGGYAGNGYQNQANQGMYGNGSQGNYSGQNGYNSYNGQGNYQSYQGNYQYGNNGYGMAGNPQNQGKGHEKKKEKKTGKPMSPFWKKALSVSVSAVCFGVIAGVSFLAVSSIGGNAIPASQNTAVTDSQKNVSDITEKDSEIKSTMTQGTASTVVTDVTEVVEATMPSIVSITNQSVASYSSWWGQTIEQEQESAGSGIIIGKNDTELLVVTNNHVVADSTKLYVKFIDDEIVEAYIKGTSPSMDLAVIAIKLEDVESDTMDNISIATMGDSDSLKVGEPVVAIGNALGYGQSVTTGVVSALNRALEVSETGTSNALIQTDAAINPGNSGGALLDIKGQVIGINSNKIGGSVVEGMGYAIPISSAQPIIEELMNQETRMVVENANRGYLGISCINVNAAMSEAYGMPEGVYVAQVYPGTGAEKAGLLKGDIIVGFGGKTVTNQEDLTSSTQYYAVGEVVEVTIMRGNPTEGYQEQKVSIELVSQEVMNAENR